MKRNSFRAPTVGRPRIHRQLAAWVVSATKKHFPRLAIARRFTRAGVGAVSFASPKCSNPVINVTEYELQVQGVGSVQSRDVPAWTLAEIAHALVKPT